MKRTLLLAMITAIFAGVFAQFPGQNDPYNGGYGYGDDNYRDDQRRRNVKRVQLALILDASGSMNGLIHQAKSQFWGILNELSYGYEGEFPIVEVALYDYGSRDANPRQGYVRRLTPMTSDLDWAADMLYDIRVGGRYEYAGHAIQRAVDELSWRRNSRVDKMIFIAGNESIRQGRTDIHRAIQRAGYEGIAVHTIFCGDYNDGVRLGWADAAYHGGGMYTALDHNAHQRDRYYREDDDLWRLNADLNRTYIPYGTRGRDRWDRQRRQDRYASDFGRGTAAQRAMYKASYGYMNPEWDLVDAVRTGTVDLRNVPESDLPSEMRGMSMTQKQQYVDQKARERDQLRNQMQQLAKTRQRQEASGQQGTPGRAMPGNANAAQAPAPAKAQSLNQAIRQSVGKKMTRKPVEVPAAGSNLGQPSSGNRQSGWSDPATSRPSPQRKPAETTRKPTSGSSSSVFSRPTPSRSPSSRTTQPEVKPAPQRQPASSVFSRPTPDPKPAPGSWREAKKAQSSSASQEEKSQKPAPANSPSRSRLIKRF